MNTLLTTLILDYGETNILLNVDHIVSIEEPMCRRDKGTCIIKMIDSTCYKVKEEFNVLANMFHNN